MTIAAKDTAGANAEARAAAQHFTNYHRCFSQKTKNVTFPLNKRV